MNSAPPHDTPSSDTRGCSHLVAPGAATSYPSRASDATAATPPMPRVRRSRRQQPSSPRRRPATCATRRRGRGRLRRGGLHPQRAHDADDRGCAERGGRGHCRPDPADVIRLAPGCIISVRHWDRLLGGLLYAVRPRVDWATLLRRSFSVDGLECPKCHGRLRVVAIITEREPVCRILAHLGMPTEPPPVARARDPTDDAEETGDDSQLALGLA